MIKTGTSRAFFAALLFFLVFAVVSRPVAAVETYRLKNGLKVILQPTPGKDAFTAQFFVHAGSTEDYPGKEGLAHLFDHMVFKVVTVEEDGRLINLITHNNGTSNATTDLDVTTYYITMPAGEGDMALELLRKMVFFPVFKEADLETEKEVVVEEILLYDDDYSSVIYEEMYATLFRDHPYRRKVAGDANSVRSVTVEDMYAFHKRFYRPDNMLLVITGNFEPSAVRDLIARRYGDIACPTEPLDRPRIAVLEAQTEPRVVVRRDRSVTIPSVMLAFPGFSGTDAGAIPSDLLASVMGEGEASRLVANILKRRQLVTSIGALSITIRQGGFFYIDFNVEPEKLSAALDAVVGEVTNLFDNPPTPEELDRGRTYFKANMISQWQTTKGINDSLGDMERVYGDWRFRDAQFAIQEKVTPETLLHTAGMIFKPENLNAVVLLPMDSDIDAEKLRQEILAAAPRFAVGKKILDAPETPRLVELPLVGGARLFYTRLPGATLASVSATVMGGILSEGPDQDGLANFTSLVWPEATRERDAIELAQYSENLGMFLSASGDSVSLSLDGLFPVDKWEDNLTLFTEVLTRPAFAAADVERLRERLLTQIKLRNDNAASMAAVLTDVMMYAGHAWGKDVLGRKKNIESFTRDDLYAFYQRSLHPKRLSIAVCADLEPGAVQDALNARLRGWREGEADPGFVIPPAPSALEGRKAAGKRIDRGQAQIYLAFRAPEWSSPDRDALSLLSYYLDYDNGPLFMELREKRGMAYEVYANYGAGPNLGSICLSMGTDPQRAKEAFDGMGDVVRQVVAQPLGEKDMQALKRSYIARYRLGMQTVVDYVDMAAASILWNEPLDYAERHIAAVEALTSEDLRRVAKYLDLERSVLAVCGAQEALDQLGVQGVEDDAP